jgi:Cupin domain
MPKPIRRVVTGHDAAGRSVFVMDGSAPHVYQRSPGSAVVTELWETRSAPADNRGHAEARHPGFHKTSSTDYAIVLSGEIIALMDEGEVLLRAGDVLIQRGTNHAWSNRTDEPAYLAFVLVDAEAV